MNLHRVIVILRTAALGATVLLACVGCSSPRNYALSEVPDVAAPPADLAALPRPIVRAYRATTPVSTYAVAAPSAGSAHTALRAVAAPASYPMPPAAPPPLMAPADACGPEG